ncbi:hypothetical protein [Saccharopolyspora sp. NPDC002376]
MLNSVLRRQEALAHRGRMDEVERRRYLAALLEFCAEHRFEPDKSLEGWLNSSVTTG